MNKSKIKILSVLPVLGQPRHSKRIDMLRSVEFEVEAISFERDYHKGRLPNCNILSLGKISHGKYIQRVWKILKALPILRNSIKNNDIVYAFSPDMAYMSIIAGLLLKKPIVFEVGDIRELQVSHGLKGLIVRKIDKYFLDKCSLLVVTAGGFLDEYYRKWLKSDIESIVIENKLEKRFEQKVHRSNQKVKITIGYFGLLRCKWSWEVLKNLAIKYEEKFEIIVAGYPIEPKTIPEDASIIDNIKFLGEYKSPDDLSELYSNIDIVWGCYPYPNKTDWNWKWARTNRFYESMYFQKPIIVLENSGDCFEIENRDIGCIVPLENHHKVVEILAKVEHNDILKWKDNVEKLEERIYIYTEEKHILRTKIIKILEEKK